MLVYIVSRYDPDTNVYGGVGKIASIWRSKEKAVQAAKELENALLFQKVQIEEYEIND